MNVIELVNKKTKMRATFLDLGATLTELYVTDGLGVSRNVVLGHENPEAYRTSKVYFGSTIGVVSNRLANGSFELDEKKYQVEMNQPTCQLHGGKEGLSFKQFDYEVNGARVTFTRMLKSMEDGYPGDREIKVTYTLTDDNALTIDYYATSTQKTLMNLTNHSYFNLSGEDTILDHTLELDATYYMDTDEASVPNGKLLSVEGSALDFRGGKKIRQIEDDRVLQSSPQFGIDHFYQLDRDEFTLSSAVNQLQMKVKTTYPTLVLYTYNYPEETIMKSHRNNKYAGIAIECQYAPNGINLEGFDTSILDSNENYQESVSYQFIIGG